jgi:hypothetical protein
LYFFVLLLNTFSVLLRCTSLLLTDDDEKRTLFCEVVIHHLLYPQYSTDVYDTMSVLIRTTSSLLHVSLYVLIRNTGNGDVKYKFYNTFVQCMESPSVRGSVSNNFAD